MEFTILNVFGDPDCLLVIADQILFEGSDPDKPGRNCLVDERSVASPAEGIVVKDGPLLDQPAPFLQILHNDLVRIFHIQPFKSGYLLGKPAVFIHRYRGAIWMDDLLLNAHPVVILSETRSTVDHPGTI